jgi:hypothetical protein
MDRRSIGGALLRGSERTFSGQNDHFYSLKPLLKLFKPMTKISESVLNSVKSRRSRLGLVRLILNARFLVIFAGARNASGIGIPLFIVP